jgi:hypothetical protein
MMLPVSSIEPNGEDAGLVAGIQTIASVATRAGADEVGRLSHLSGDANVLKGIHEAQIITHPRDKTYKSDTQITGSSKIENVLSELNIEVPALVQGILSTKSYPYDADDAIQNNRDYVQLGANIGTTDAVTQVKGHIARQLAAVPLPHARRDGESGESVYGGVLVPGEHAGLVKTLPDSYATNLKEDHKSAKDGKYPSPSPYHFLPAKVDEGKHKLEHTKGESLASMFQGKVGVVHTGFDPLDEFMSKNTAGADRPSSVVHQHCQFQNESKISANGFLSYQNAEKDVLATSMIDVQGEETDRQTIIPPVFNDYDPALCTTNVNAIQIGAEEFDLTAGIGCAHAFDSSWKVHTAINPTALTQGTKKQSQCRQCGR